MRPQCIDPVHCGRRVSMLGLGTPCQPTNWRSCTDTCNQATAGTRANNSMHRHCPEDLAATPRLGMALAQWHAPTSGVWPAKRVSFRVQGTTLPRPRGTRRQTVKLHSKANMRSLHALATTVTSPATIQKILLRCQLGKAIQQWPQPTRGVRPTM